MDLARGETLVHLAKELTDLVFLGGYKVFVGVPSKRLVDLILVVCVVAHLPHQVLDGFVVVAGVFQELAKV